MTLPHDRFPGNRLRHLFLPKRTRAYIPKAIKEGVVRFGSWEARAFILPDHRRVLTHQAFLELLDIGRGGIGKQRGYRLGNFVAQNRFSDFISNELKDVIFHPILFRTLHRGQYAYGYEATVLGELCLAIMKARDAKRLTEQQRHIAERALLLLEAFCLVGIISLVDEATGHQSSRAQDALQRYVHDIVLTYYRRKWKKAFDLQWFEQLCRLKGWDFDPHTMRLPRNSRSLVDRLVYQRLTPGVREALHLRNPKRADGTRRDKNHQWLSEAEGLRELNALLQGQLRLMKASQTWEEFLALLNRFYPMPSMFDEAPEVRS